MKNEHMRQKILLMLAVVFFTLSVPFGPKTCKALEVSEKPTASFPASLRTLQEEAFFGTSIEVALFQEGFSYIGKNAFGNTTSLRDVYIPQSIEYISADAFSGSILIHTADKSYAQKWAEEHAVECVLDYEGNPKDVWKRIQVDQILVLLCIVACVDMLAVRSSIRVRRRTEVFVKSMRPQDRPELYPIQYRFP